MEFYQAAGNYVLAHDLLSKESIAQHIYDTFVAPDAPKMINIPSESVQEIQESIESLDAELFKNAKTPSLQTYEEDS
eukprot:TRINITY_DN17514_c0_g1_i1.p1 TRINITY_DN17514_c0_g1~~TRINITY_DN17514_c0_g1_i1.p1  ORF type:complete len:77 (+),score=11.02 TRINITY_DN17514_c0_g1_i1:418-648(+)